MNSFFIHVGLHKTGTTALQIDIFPKVDGVRYIGRHIGSSAYGDELYEDIVRYSFFNSDKKSNLRTLRERIEKTILNTNILLSEEWFTSDYDFYTSGRNVRWQEKIYRLATLLKGFPIKLLVTIREPTEAMFSMYCEQLQSGEGMKYDTFYQFAVCNNSALAYRRKYLDSLLVSLFGVEPIYLDIEEIKDGSFHQKLSDMFGVNVPTEIKKRNTKQMDDTGVEIVSANGIYIAIRNLWLRAPLWFRKTLSDRAYQAIRHNLRARNSSKSVISNPSAEEIAAVKQLLNTGK